MNSLVFLLEQTLGHRAHARNIARAVASMSDSVDGTIIPIAPRSGDALTSRIPGVRTWSFEASRQARRAMGGRLAAGHVDAVFIHTQVAALLVGDLMRTVPTIVSLDATPINYDSEGAFYGHARNSALVEAVKLRINQSVFRGAAHLVTWCRWAADSLVADYGVPAEKISVIHPGVDVGLFRPSDRDARHERVRVLFVGGDFERKGGSDLMEAVRTMQTPVELDLVTASPVNPPPGIVCRIHRNLAPQSSEIVRLYRDADIFVLPSRGDCFPQAVAEGLASGLPVVATRVGAIPEMVRDGVTGFLVPRRDSRALGIALEKLAASADLRRRMGIAGRAEAEQEHDADRNNRRIIELMVEMQTASGRRLAAARRC